MDEHWKQIEAAFKDLFERQWYTNQGPLARQLETQLQGLFSVRNAVCVVNPAIGLAMALETVATSHEVCLVAADSQQINETRIDKWLHQAHAMNTHLLIDCKDLRATELKKLMTALPRQPKQGRWIALLPMDRESCMDAQGGACLVTDDDELADILRNIRSSYGVRHTVPVNKTANGRMSEAQAAFGLIALKTLETREA